MKHQARRRSGVQQSEFEGASISKTQNVMFRLVMSAMKSCLHITQQLLARILCSEGKQYDVKREIPELLLDEFQELQKEATEIRKKANCQTYIGFAGHDIFLRRRKETRGEG